MSYLTQSSAPALAETVVDEEDAEAIVRHLDIRYDKQRPGQLKRTLYLDMMLDEHWLVDGAWAAVNAWSRSEAYYPELHELRDLYSRWERKHRALYGMPVAASVGIEALPVPVVDTGAMWRDFWAQLLAWASLLRSIADAQQRQELWERRQRPLSPGAQAKWRELGHRLGKYSSEETESAVER